MWPTPQVHMYKEIPLLPLRLIKDFTARFSKVFAIIKQQLCHKQPRRSDGQGLH